MGDFGTINVNQYFGTMATESVSHLPVGLMANLRVIKSAEGCRDAGSHEARNAIGNAMYANP